MKNSIIDLFMPLTRILSITTNWQQSGQACFSDAGTRLYFPVPYLPLTHVTSHSMLHVLESRIYLVLGNMLIESYDISERLESCRMTGTQALCTMRWCAVWMSRSRLIENFFTFHNQIFSVRLDSVDCIDDLGNFGTRPHLLVYILSLRYSPLSLSPLALPVCIIYLLHLSMS